MAVTGSPLSSPAIAARGSTVMCWQRATSVAFSISLSSGGDLGVFHPGSGNLAIFTPSSSHDVVAAANSIKVGEYYLVGWTITAAGAITMFVGKMRHGAGNPTVSPVAVYFDPTPETIAAVSNAINVFTLGPYTWSGAASRLVIWDHELTHAEVVAAAQLSVTESSPWGSGGLPTTPWAYYPLAVHTDLTDHSGNGRAALTQSGSNTTTTGPASLPNPNTLLPSLSCCGDSITRGYPDAAHSYSTYLTTLLPVGNLIQNYGHDSQSYDNAIPTAQSDVYPNYQASSTYYNVALLRYGTNDILGGGASSSAVLASLAACVNYFQAMGFTIIVANITPWWAAAGTNTVRAAYNAAMLLDPQGCDYAIGSGDDVYWDPNDTSKFYDGLHLQPTSAGYGHDAANWYAGINAWLATFSGAAAVASATPETRRLLQGFYPHLRM